MLYTPTQVLSLSLLSGPSSISLRHLIPSGLSSPVTFLPLLLLYIIVALVLAIKFQ